MVSLISIEHPTAMLRSLGCAHAIAPHVAGNDGTATAASSGEHE